jgi:MFS family permease
VNSVLVISGISYIFSTLLIAITPDNPSYWAYIFPAMICATLGIDITYNVTNIFITTSMPKARQGLAGALINSLLFLGISVMLGFADLAVTETAHQGKKKSYKAALFLGTASAAVGLVVMALGVRIGKAESGLTADEKAELERELSRRQSVGQ